MPLSIKRRAAGHSTLWATLTRPIWSSTMDLCGSRSAARRSDRPTLRAMRELLAAALLVSLTPACAWAGSAPAVRSPAAHAATARAGPTGAGRMGSACGVTPAVAPGTSAEQQVAVDPKVQLGHARRSYRLHVPARYAAMQPVPVLLDSHGYGGSAESEEKGSSYDHLADRDGFLAVYPQGLTAQDAPGWASAARLDLGVDEIAYFGAVLDQLERQFCVDQRRVYATGFSNGGGMTEMLACYLSNRIAAVAPVSGNYYLAAKQRCRPPRPVAILATHGTADPVIPYAGVSRAENPGWPLLSIPDFMASWAARDGCQSEPVTFLDSQDVTGLRWEGCVGRVSVVHYRWNGGGHALPAEIGGEPAREVIWRFLASYSLSI